MKAKLKLFSTFLLSLVFSLTTKISTFIDPPFLSPSKIIPLPLRIDYIFDTNNPFDDFSQQFLTDLLESSLQVTFYLLQDTSLTLSPSTSNSPFCPEFFPSNLPPSDLVLLLTNNKNSKNSFTITDCSSTLSTQKLGLVEINIPLILAENEDSAIYSVTEGILKTYFKNTEILEKLDTLFSTNLGISCTATCKVCNTNTGSCVTCFDPTHMAIKNGICYCTDPNAIFFSPTSSCVCKNGYFTNGTSLCAPCPSICAACSSLTSCTSCISPTQMTLYNNWCYCSSPEGSVFNSTSLLCNCPSGTWNNQQNCQNCNAACSACSSEDFCTACADAEHMNLIGGVCSCKVPNTVFNETLGLCECGEGFYINNTACVACEAPCESCSSENYCDRCVDSSHMALSNGKCTCSVENTYFNTTTELCTCYEGQYLNNSLCVKCITPCGFCSSATYCDTCVDPTMTLSNGVCTCPANTTFNMNRQNCVCNNNGFMNSGNCIPCPSACATCYNSSYCFTCANPNQMTIINGMCTCIDPSATFNTTSLLCECINGYYIGSSGNCTICPIGCISCTSQSNCLSCFQSSYGLFPYTLINGVCTCSAPNTTPWSNNGCFCSDGYYLPQNIHQCAKCPSPCDTCIDSGASVYCWSCIDNRMNNDNGYCQCPANSTFSYQSNSCQCNEGLYFEGSFCTSCSLPCASCLNSPNYCTSCIFPNQMELNNGNCNCVTPTNSIYNSQLNQCVCRDQWYLNNTSCNQCDETCMTCENSTGCLTCIDNRMTLSNGICNCPENSYFDGNSCICINNHYYWNNNFCVPCQPPCLYCSIQASTCTYCYDSNHMILNNGVCTCMDPNAYFDFSQNICACNNGYFMYNSICQPCQATCATCLNNTACSGCVDQTHMNLVNGICTCTDPNSSFNIFSKSCVCTPGYINNGICIACPINCNWCISSNVCTECANPNEMSLIEGNCVCNLANSIYDPISNSCICEENYYLLENECVQCLSPMCSTCENTKCLSCIDTVNMTLRSGDCFCNDPNSYFNPASGYCQCNKRFVAVFNENALECLPSSGPCIEVAVDGTCLQCIETKYSKMWIYKSQCYCITPNMYYDESKQDCICNAGYFLDKNSGVCMACSHIPGCTLCKWNKCRKCVVGMYTTDESCQCGGDLIWDNSLKTCICPNSYQYQEGWKCVNCGCPVCSLTGECVEPCPQNSVWSNITNTCECNSGFYNCGLQCCSLSRTCTSFSNNVCTNCVSSMTLDTNSNCQCVYNLVYSPEFNYCICPQNYYNTCVGCECQQCGNYCNECTSPTECTSCYPTFFNDDDGDCDCDPYAFISENNNIYTCVCEHGFFMNSTYSCVPCPDTCRECISPTNCTACHGDYLLVNNQCICPDVHAIYDSNEYQCVCATGYYNNTISCVSCLETCFGCEEDGITCTSCKDEDNMILNNGVCKCIDPNAIFNSTTLSCECPYGYYNNVCSVCEPSCSDCENNQCLSCYDPTHMVLAGNTCTCVDPNAYFVEWAKVCACKSGFYSSGQICVPFPGLMWNKKA